LGAGHGLENGDLVVYHTGAGNAAINGLANHEVYQAEGDIADPARIRLKNTETGAVISLDAAGAGSAGHFLEFVSPWRYTINPSVAVSGNQVKLGADHGLETGNMVVYHAGTGNAAIGGLANDKAYIVTVDAAQPDMISLKDVTTGALMTLNASAATGLGHVLEVVNPVFGGPVGTDSASGGPRFEILSPRRVRLADSFEHTEPGSIVTIDLADPLVSGFGHTLMPYQGSSPAVSFNPSTALDSATDTINLGTNHGFSTGQPVIYRKGTGPSLTISASGDDYNFARSEAGSGGVITGSAAEANVVNTSITRASIADNTGDAVRTRIVAFLPSAVAGNAITLGTAHGLHEGMRVVYHAGMGTAIGGLTDGEIYVVTVDAADPNTIRLKSTESGSVVALDPSAATGSGHLLEIVDPRILAFTPSATVIDNAIDLGPDHGLQTGDRVVYHAGTGNTAIGGLANDEIYFVELDAVHSALIRLKDAANRIIDLGASAATGLTHYLEFVTPLIDVSSLTITADHTAQFDSQTNSLQASIVGYSGSWADNRVSSTVEATVGNNVEILTQDFEVNAINRSRKNLVPQGQYNVQAGSGGAIEGTAAKSETDIVNVTHAFVGANATITVTGNIYEAGDFLVSALNDVEAYDDVRIDAGGLILGSKAASKIRANVNDAIVRIGDNAHVTTVGNVDLQTRANGILKVEPQVHTYGLASAAKIDGLASVHSNDQVNVGSNAVIQARGNINLLAGRDRNGAVNYFIVTSHGDELNASLLPISDLKAHGEIIENSHIFVGSGAELSAARDANLFAERYTNAEIWAYGSGKNWMTALANAIDSLFGSGGVSEEMKGGSSTLLQDTEVRIDGTVRVGTERSQELEIMKDGSVLTQTKGITFTHSTEDVALKLVEQWEKWKQLFSEYEGDPIAQAAYMAEISRVEQQMRDLGLFTKVTDPDGKERIIYTARYTSPFITVDDIWAQAGTINITGDDLVGSGNLFAPGDVHVTIVNHSPANLEVNRITVPEQQGGMVRFNYQEVAGNADIAAINKSEAPLFGDVQVGGSQNGPVITITSDFSAMDQTDPAYAGFRIPDIYVNGTITNIMGEVTIDGSGSIFVQSDINAGTLNIVSDQDFVLSYSDALVNAGGEPRYAWKSVTDITEYLGRSGYLSGFSSDNNTMVSVSALINSGAASLDHLVHSGQLVLSNFNNVELSPDSLVSLGLLTQAQVDELAPSTTDPETGTVFRPALYLYTVVDYGISHSLFTLEDLIGKDIKVVNQGGLFFWWRWRAVQSPKLSLADLNVTQLNFGNFIRSYTDTIVHQPSRSNIIAANNVFISAQYLNVNGTIQSGMPERSVTISLSETARIDAAKTAYNYWRSGDRTLRALAQSIVKSNGLTTGDFKKFELPADSGDNIKVFFNAELNRLELEPVTGRGGYMELFGKVVSTGSGKLNVLDGYGNITITNETGYDLVTNLLDSGRGVEGKIKITDTSFVNETGWPRVVEYTRRDGYVYEKTYYVSQPGVVSEGPDAGGNARTAVYETEQGNRYYWQTGQNYILVTNSIYAKSTWLGIDCLARDPGNRIYGPVRYNVDADPLMIGEYLQSSVDTSDYSYRFVRANTDRDLNGDGVPETEPITRRWTWSHRSRWGKKTYYLATQTIEGKKDIHAHSIRADRPINIEFIGLEDSDPRVGVSVTSGGSILIAGSIQNEAGATTLTSGREIKAFNQDVIISGEDITLRAAAGIGAGIALRTNLTNSDQGTLNAITGSGDIQIEEISGELKIGQVTTSLISGNVILTASEDILAADAGSLVRGRFVTLTTEFGDIGSLGTNGTAAQPAGDALSLRVDTGSGSQAGLLATAVGDVYLTEVNGDLRLNRVETFGDVRIEVDGGNLVDVNGNEVRDLRTEQELLAMWDRMWATEATAQQSIDATISAYEGMKTREYRAYWQYRNQQPDPSVYDPAFRVSLSAGEPDFYTAY